MAFKLTKAEQKRVSDIAAKMDAEFSAILDLMEETKQVISRRLETFNEAREELRGVIEDIHAEKQDEYDEKSDNWREGERGDATYQWLDALASAMIDFEDDLEVELEDIDRPDALAKLIDEGLPVEPEY